MRIVCQNLEHPYARVAARIIEGRLFDAGFDGRNGGKPPCAGSEGPRGYYQSRTAEETPIQPVGVAPTLSEGVMANHAL
ncbi:hypothetical protein NSK_005648 [Nannochloropsis salina CCMP1776]|uniref:Uncharacterized protein n=1 Tax=Nannochloropsis salina CCMP1776 TaxID=1027361 RepID=A0A4D9CZH3_9STRA|nr:hypothetical protein NSK_005648 [Nannochloropsis salina CCMP1776]|eukprot:TFJ83023.1 hypothetical protein NSK_005648 [Nannochloropsis salina CCMP1776]